MLAVRAAAARGAWTYTDMGGLVGLSWPTVHLLHDDPATWPETRELLRSFEAGAVEGAGEAAARRREERERDG